MSISKSLFILVEKKLAKSKIEYNSNQTQSHNMLCNIDIIQYMVSRYNYKIGPFDIVHSRDSAKV